jgi:hypothetical protein
MDLAPLLAVERAAESLITQAVAELAAGQPAAAIECLMRAQGLITDPLIGHLTTFAKTLSQAPARPESRLLNMERPWHGPS